MFQILLLDTLAESCVFEIALVSLVGVVTYEKILRPTQNPTLAGMDPLLVILMHINSHVYFTLIAVSVLILAIS